MAEDLGNLIANMDNMTIEELGGSLLSRQAKINAERKKEAKKAQKIQNALGIIGIGQALTKEAFKRRAEEADNIQSFLAPTVEPRAESARVTASAINHIDQVDFESEDYKNYRNDPNLNSYWKTIGVENPTEADYRATYLKNNNLLENFSAAFREPIDAVIRQTYGNGYEQLVTDRESYQYLQEVAAYDIAKHFLTNVNEKGGYTPRYENFIKEMTDLYSQDGIIDMDREDILRISMGLTPIQLSGFERKYFKGKKQKYRKGLFGGVSDMFRKITGVAAKHNAPNIFETLNNIDMYGNRQMNDGLYEINVSSIIRESTTSAVAELKKGGQAELPIGADSNARIEYKNNPELQSLAEGDGEVPGIFGFDGEGRFYEEFYANKQFKEQQQSLLANMAIPMFEGKNETTRSFNFFRRGRKFKNYTSDLTTTEIQIMNEQTGILAQEMENNPEFARKIFNEMAETVDGWTVQTPEGAAEVNELFDSYYASADGRLFMAGAMVARNGLYSKRGGAGLFRPDERYKTPPDIVEEFTTGFNEFGGVLPLLTDNLITITENGITTKEGYSKLHAPQKAAVFHQTFLGISENQQLDNKTKTDLLNNLFETISHPIVGNTTLSEYLTALENEESKNMLFGSDIKIPTSPPEFSYSLPLTSLEAARFSAGIPTLPLPDVQVPIEIPNFNVKAMDKNPIFKMEEFKGTELADADYEENINLIIDRMQTLEILPDNINSDVLEYKLNRLAQFTAYAESRLDGNAESGVGAKSLFQFKDESAKTAYNRLVRELPEGVELPDDIIAMAQSGNFSMLDKNGNLRLSPSSQVLLTLSNYIEDRAVDIETGKTLKEGTGSGYMKTYLSSGLDSSEEKEALKNLYMNIHHKSTYGLTGRKLRPIQRNFRASYDKYFNPSILQNYNPYQSIIGK